MTEYSRLAKGSFTSTGAARAVILPFIPDRVELINYTAAATPAQNGIPFAFWDSGMGQGFSVNEVFNATPVLTTSVLTSGGISTFSAGLDLQYGPSVLLGAGGGITKANPAVVTTTAAHGLATGDWVVFQNLYQTTTTGMPQISGIPFRVTVLSTTTFSIPWNTNQSNYTAIVAGGLNTLAQFKKVLFPMLYSPDVSTITSITLGASTTVVTTTEHDLVVGSEVGFRIPTQWGTTELNSLPNNTIPGSPKYGYVISVTDSRTVVVNINSSAFTAFNSNQTVASVPGLTFPQMFAAGDVNSGGLTISSGSVLYPSPLALGVSTINGPAINGAFINNTRQGFTIGTGNGTTSPVGANNDVIYWRAFLDDIQSP